MTHPISRVIEVELAGIYTLRVKFDDGTEQVINFRPVLGGDLWAVAGSDYFQPS